MNRRQFLNRFGSAAVLAAATAAGVVDADAFLWQPGEKTIILPPSIVAPTFTETVAFAGKPWEEANRISMRFIQGFDDVKSDLHIARFDVLYGMAVVKDAWIRVVSG